ncbi:MAG: hypothetical protein IJY71_00690 [Clostridia bacterium]|nr:hypothetical protein [Clostridia bacterium]
MQEKRITIFSGHYGSGKTNIAVNHALALREKHSRVVIADIDIVNPYFRTKDSEALLAERDIRLICSAYANSNVDIPALPPEIYAVTDDKSLYAVLDVGGDERGALALGRLVPAIREENDYEMVFVLNRFRPLTRDLDGVFTVMREIEAACGLRFTALINNSNLGAETTEEDVRGSVAFAKEVAAAANIPFWYTTVHESLWHLFSQESEDYRPILLQKRM